MTEATPLTGRLLVAGARLSDPNFSRTVVLLLDHDEDGALGVVLNRPTEVDVDRVLQGWGALAGTPAVIFRGGPVGPDSGLGLAVLPGEERGSREVLGWRRVSGAIGLVDLDTPPELLASVFGALRVFVGYAGWGPGQLEGEIAEGSWHVLEAEAGDVASPRPERLWRDVLRRQRGALALLATYPEDPSLN